MAVPVSDAVEADQRLPPYLLPHLPEPDYSRPLLQLTAEQRARLLDILTFLYRRQDAEACFGELDRLMKVHHAHKTPEMIEAERTFDPRERFTERDIVLITYGDLLTNPGRTPLQVLSDFLLRFMRGTINTVHILPFFPYSSDRGFSIIDYEEVDPRLGTWQDIERLSHSFRLMFDGVFNHASSKSRWFQRFLNGRPGYEDFFVAFTTKDAIGEDHLRLILRPRTSSLVTPYRTINGQRYVWTTFSSDQVDLNFKNPRVLQRVVEVLLYYVRRGADAIRLDAVTYIWHELGTSCAHLRQGHAVVQLFRAILDVVAPHVALITETNVRHADNISYFGDGSNEAQMVYNFALPPLVLHTLHTANARRLNDWAKTLEPPSRTTAFFNFLASHDGIGLLGAQGLLTSNEINALVEKTTEHGGLVSYKDNGDGTKSPYELNISFYSALNRDDVDESVDLQVGRFICARAIALAIRGVAGVYFPMLFGAKNDTEAVLAGRDARSINRRTIDEASLYARLLDRKSWVHKTATRFRRLIKRRTTHPAFHPNAPQEIVDVDERAFILLRGAHESRRRVVAIHNVTAQPLTVDVPLARVGGGPAEWVDIITRRGVVAAHGQLAVRLEPYGVLWLEPQE
ncbi:MAG: sugar phosphorylase [Luteitalea sp.]|nr:sugar phosphorylase [Luteitalea sp.]